jgi:hypothetical protein
MNYGRLELMLKNSNKENISLNKELRNLQDDYGMIKCNIACLPVVYFAFNFFEKMPIFGTPYMGISGAIMGSLIISGLLVSNYRDYKKLSKKVNNL